MPSHPHSNLSQKWNAYLQLTKPRIVTLVLVTTALGYYLGGDGRFDYAVFLWLVLGAGLVCAGSSTLNNYLERESDCKMLRTKNRAIPLGIITPLHALNYGIVLILSGLIILYTRVNLLTAFLSLLTAFLYVLIYTPMKKVSWLNTTIGSIPGAIPPMGGWAAATGYLEPGAWVLFLILVLWQHPHFYAIAWMYREDYKRAGFKMLSVMDHDGRRMFQQILWYSVILIPVSILPTVIGLTGIFYSVGAFICGVVLLRFGQRLMATRSLKDARHLLQATVFYLPILLILIIVDISL